MTNCLDLWFELITRKTEKIDEDEEIEPQLDLLGLNYNLDLVE